MKVKKNILFAIFSILYSSIFAESPIFGVWSEGWFRWTKHSYAITETDFKYRDNDTKVQTRYPYYISGNYIILSEPDHYRSDSPRMPDMKFTFERDGDYLTLHLSTGDVNCVLNDKINSVKTTLLTTGGICVATGVIAYAGGKIINYNKCAAVGENFTASTSAYTNFSKGIVQKSGLFKPNLNYTSCGYNYKTDSLGRISNYSGKLKLQNGVRNKAAQVAAGGNDRLANDDGGHLIATIFGGSGTSENLVAMNSSINRGEYKKLENLWASALAAGKTVSVDGQCLYNGNSERPTKFIITYIIDGIKNKATIFNTY
ncbi:MAG: DNA/RNA non-specific endonuclease [Spirochaetia bacterium]|nr:DNA/RNA non-specific endonuclease [Spirochaetia bacterium]